MDTTHQFPLDLAKSLRQDLFYCVWYGCSAAVPGAQRKFDLARDNLDRYERENGLPLTKWEK